ncbi:hypothetical protein [Synechococcus sp. PCC 7336]|uniref:hypothetical protein n=1 Tax=Synechococcus sp. PCC 7336 TaxID=195250 RepID=UPI000349E788|nr:hypothetical protein [Synechococcus sp. PCC 7336]
MFILSADRLNILSVDMTERSAKVLQIQGHWFMDREAFSSLNDAILACRRLLDRDAVCILVDEGNCVSLWQKLSNSMYSKLVTAISAIATEAPQPDPNAAPISRQTHFRGRAVDSGTSKSLQSKTFEFRGHKVLSDRAEEGDRSQQKIAFRGRQA